MIIDDAHYDMIVIAAAPLEAPVAASLAAKAAGYPDPGAERLPSPGRPETSPMSILFQKGSLSPQWNMWVAARRDPFNPPGDLCPGRNTKI